METVSEINAAIKSLSTEDQLEVLGYLLTTIHRQNSPALDAAWQAEVRTRINEIKEGSAKGVPLDEPLLSAWAKLHSHLKFEEAAKHVFSTHADLMRKLSE